jgi:pyruvate/2-oxoglutarate dehydrogenase complex dihydrolipoamide acyltransferase (E2) component
MFDHDVTDGAPVARFIRRLQELMTNQYGLED